MKHILNKEPYNLPTTIFKREFKLEGSLGLCVRWDTCPIPILPFQPLSLGVYYKPIMDMS